MTVIESKDYEETRKRLMVDPIVVTMSLEVHLAPAEVRSTMVHDDGTPRFEFMQQANDEYRRRGGTDGGHIGAVAEAILRNVKILDEFL